MRTAARAPAALRSSGGRAPPAARPLAAAARASRRAVAVAAPPHVELPTPQEQARVHSAFTQLARTLTRKPPLLPPSLPPRQVSRQALALRPVFADVDAATQINLARVLSAFRTARVGNHMFAGAPPALSPLRFSNPNRLR
jgi:hypothetical protein